MWVGQYEFLNCGYISLSYYNWVYIVLKLYYKDILYFIMYILPSDGPGGDLRGRVAAQGKGRCRTAGT